MTRKAIVSTDPLIMKVRNELRRIEPRPQPTETRRNEYGHGEVKCPICGEWCRAKKGSYNHHWTLMHGTPFWKEQHLINVIKKELSK